MNNLHQQFTVEAIRKRIAQNAANMWQVKNIDALDPFVRMLAELFANEIASVGNYTAGIEQRLLPSIAATLLPQLYKVARPAHTLVHCRPRQATQHLHQHTQFIFRRKEADFRAGMSSYFDDYYFSPLDSTTVYDAPVVCMASGYHLSSVSPTLQKTVIAHSGTSKHLPPQHLWLGIEAPQTWDTMHGLNLYFDFGAGGEQWMNDTLPLCRFYVDGTLIAHDVGFRWNNKEHTSDYGTSQAAASYIHHHYRKELKHVYQQDFLHLPTLSKASFSDFPAIPKQLIECFGDAAFESFTKPLIWLKVVLPATYDFAILDGLAVSTSTVPVANFIYQSSVHSLTEDAELLPIVVAAGEELLSIATVQSGKGKDFEESFAAGNNNPNTFRIQYDRQPRFDNRAMRHYIQYIPELLRDEHAAFTTIGHELITNVMGKMKAIIKGLEMSFTTRKAGDRTVAAYLYFNTAALPAMITLDYYTTQHEEANGIPAGALLEQANTDYFDGTTLQLIKATRGGRKQLDAENSMRGYQYMMQTSDTIVTSEDIRQFCLFELEGLIKDVTVTKELIASHHPKQGYIRAILIALHPYNAQQFSSSQWQLIVHDTLAKIKFRGVPGVHFILSIG